MDGSHDTIGIRPLPGMDYGRIPIDMMERPIETPGIVDKWNSESASTDTADATGRREYPISADTADSDSSQKSRSHKTIDLVSGYNWDGHGPSNVVDYSRTVYVGNVVGRMDAGRNLPERYDGVRVGPPRNPRSPWRGDAYNHVIPQYSRKAPTQPTSPRRVYWHLLFPP